MYESDINSFKLYMDINIGLSLKIATIDNIWNV